MMRQEEKLLEAFWSNEEQGRKPLPRRDVTKSRRGGQLLQKSTIPHVATSPRRDVTTSRRLLKILHLIIKCEGARESRVSKCVRPETGIGRTCNTDLENILRFLYWFSYLFGLLLDDMRIFLILHILFFSFMMF